MTRNNYQYEKRQKDIAKKKKQEEKRLKRFNKNSLTGEADERSEDTINPEHEAGDDSEN